MPAFNTRKPAAHDRHVCTHLDRTNRRQRASERKIMRALRSDSEQLAILNTRPGNAARERARLGA